MRVLVDTSVWSEALRRRTKLVSDSARELRSLILEHRVDIIGPIRQEILSGLRDKGQLERLDKQLAAFPDLALESDDYTMAATFFNVCRSRGVQASNTDFLICATAVRRNLSIFTTDKDFTRFAKYIPIVLHQTRELDAHKSSRHRKPS